MKRIRWAFVLLLGLVLLGTGGASVFAGSSTTYENHLVAPTTFASTGDHAAKPGQVGVWDWLGYGQTATWKVADASVLATAISGSVYLNFAALSTGASWGAGYSTQLSVVVSGTGKTTVTTWLSNPWRPHIAYNDVPGVGWAADATVAVPRSVVAGGAPLTVTVTPVTPGNHVGMSLGALLIGYATTG